MSPLRRSQLLVLAASLLVPAIARAQDPWTVTVYSTMNPLPIGTCAAVRLDVKDPNTRDVPRTPSGARVTITDFDVTVTSADGRSVAPYWIDAYHLNACGCQRGTAGTSGLITATYPARALAPEARVRDVSIRVTGGFSLAKPQNAVDPPGCTTPSVAPALAATALPVSPISTVTKTAPTTVAIAPAPAPIPSVPKVSTAPVATLPPSPIPTTQSLPAITPETFYAWWREGIPANADSLWGQSIEELRRALTAWMTATGNTAVLVPLAEQPVGGRTPTAAPAPVPTALPAAQTIPLSGSSTPLSGAAGSGTTRTATGVTPTGFRLASSVPIIASLVWDAMPNAVTYSVKRAVGTATPTERVTLAAAAEKGVRDTIPDPRDAYIYTLVVTYADGTWGTSPAVTFASPPLKNPSGFTAKHTGEGNVDFQWNSVDGAAQYRLDGPGIPAEGFHTTSTSTTYAKIPGGANSWKLTTLYQGNFADYANPSTASAVVRVLPPHTVPWLSKNNGIGSVETVQAPRIMASFQRSVYISSGSCTAGSEGAIGGDLTEYDPRKVSWLGLGDRICGGNSFELVNGLKQWLNFPAQRLWLESPQFVEETKYGNAVDLGVGRRTFCTQSPHPRSPGTLTTMCYATAHGVVPGQAGFNDFNTITSPGEGAGDDFILSMVISKDFTGTTFLVFLKDSLGGYGRLAPTVSLDTEGPKYVPHACISCHGGKYNPTTRKVDGASFLPLDPGLLEFASPDHQSSQEEGLRNINAMIVASDPTSAVAAYIRGLYGNAVSVPGALAKADYVPQGWSAQAGFYRSVVKPYCATCHLAAPASWNFASWDNFKENAALIKVAVCNAHTMPHSELQYKAFWTKDTGPVYTPGLLATTLGLPSCP